MRRGCAPDGRRYWPVFPYPAFSALTASDLSDLWAFLGALPPVGAPPVEQDPSRSGFALGVWRTVAFRARPWKPLPDAELDRGAYLVEVVGHCDGCHSERSALGLEKAHLAGSDQEPHGGPNLTPSERGIGSWTVEELTSFFEIGQTPDGDFVGGGMRHVIRGTAQLPEADRRAMALYLRSLPPR